MKENLNIDELLNAFVDGELDVRHQTEVKRLIDHDPKIAEKLDGIQRCKKLVNSLPCERSPEHIFKDICAALERETLLSEPVEHFDHRKGAMQLMFRKVLSAAAMLALVAGLVFVILNVVMPEQEVENIVENIKFPATIVEKRPIEQVVAVVEKAAVKTVSPAIVFNGRLELQAENFVTADSFIAKAIVDNDLVEDCQVSSSRSGKKIFTVSCSHEKMMPFLSGLAKGWYQFGSTRLTIADAKQSMGVNAVTAEQVMEIVRQNDMSKQIKAAKYFAFTNNMKQPSSEQILTAKDVGDDLMDIPQPTLTSPPIASDLAGQVKQAQQKVQLVIVLGR